MNKCKTTNNYPRLVCKEIKKNVLVLQICWNGDSRMFSLGLNDWAQRWRRDQGRIGKSHLHVSNWMNWEQTIFFLWLLFSQLSKNLSVWYNEVVGFLDPIVISEVSHWIYSRNLWIYYSNNSLKGSLQKKLG